MQSPDTNLLNRLVRSLGLHPGKKATIPPTPPTPMQENSTPSPKSRGPSPIAITATPDLYLRQASCRLISKLPIELRDLIWEYVLGGNTIHMYWQDRDTLLGYVCERQAKCISLWHEENARARPIKWDSAVVIRDEEIEQGKGYIDLLVTCRAVYFEATRILYARNTFDFSDHWPNFRFLKWSVPVRDLWNVERVTMTCHGVPLPSAKADFVDWKKTWEALSLLRGLRYLRVWMVAATGGVQPVTRGLLMQAEDELLEPVRAVDGLLRRGMGVAELVLPFDERLGGTVARELREVGWRIVRV